MNTKIKYQFSAKIWQDNLEGGWHFVTIPKGFSTEIRKNLQWQEEGWGRMKASVIIKEISWNTSIWFDTKINCYILPVKAEVRKKSNIKKDQTLEVTLFV
ncbi:DUF1905 domain-containing protein [uncultured Maribacter sp.]|uniref:DUF1905 domain-containing protein n=1 Tax=uncultured Maribacter sp. TaxID=431308 RepID=UPI0026381517|nr:DUF1905 domain-containing protein [uncultured Maribacter sp.]